MNTHDIHYGDSLTPIGLQLKRKDTAGDLSPIDLTGKTVQVVLCDSSGAVVIAETDVGVTVVDADDGKISYSFPSGASALDPGTYYLYARVYVGAVRDTYPVLKKEMRIVVHEHEDDEYS